MAGPRLHLWSIQGVQISHFDQHVICRNVGYFGRKEEDWIAIVDCSCSSVSQHGQAFSIPLTGSRTGCGLIPPLLPLNDLWLDHSQDVGPSYEPKKTWELETHLLPGVEAATATCLNAINRGSTSCCPTPMFLTRFLHPVAQAYVMTVTLMTYENCD